jgi:hypothetical protein
LAIVQTATENLLKEWPVGIVENHAHSDHATAQAEHVRGHQSCVARHAKRITQAASLYYGRSSRL